MVTAALVTALQGGVRLDYSADPQRPVFRVTPAQRPLLTPLLTPDAKPETQRVLAQVAAYRAVLLRLFALAGQGAAADHAAAASAVQEEMRLLDDLGPALARVILTDTEREYVTATHLCAYCGGPH